MSDDERLDFGALADELTASGTPTTLCADTPDILRRATKEARQGDVVAVTMSSGSFEGMPYRVYEALRA